MQASDCSDHARVRMQQRGIPPAVLDCLLEFGRVTHDHHGAQIIYFDKAARRKIGRAGIPRGRVDIEKHLNAYAVVACDGTVKTVGHRYRRINRA